MVQVVLAADGDQERWDAYAASKPEVRLYHRFAWRHVLSGSFGHEPFYLMAFRDGRVAGIFPLILMKSMIMGTAMVSVPFLNYGGVLADSPEVESSLVDEGIRIAKKAGARYLEIRGPDRSPFFSETRQHKVTMLLGLSRDSDEQWRKFDAKVRNEIRKGQKSGLAIRGGGGENLADFYDVFSRNMKMLGTPVLGRNFFEHILKYFSQETAIFVVTREGKAVAACFTLNSGNVFQVPWASSLRTCNKYCPNEFMYWEVIRYAITQHADVFDFGRCTRGSGTYRFKRQWGAQEKQLYWQYWAETPSRVPQENPQKGSFGLLSAIWKKLPLCVANSLGPVVAQNLTTF